MSEVEITEKVHELTKFVSDTTPRKKLPNIIGHLLNAGELSQYDGYELMCRVTNPLAFASLGAAQWAVISRRRAQANDEQDKLVSPNGLGSDAFGEFLKTSHTEEIGFATQERNGAHTIELYLTAYALARKKGTIVFGPEWKPRPEDGGMQPYALKNAWQFRLTLQPTGEIVNRMKDELNTLLMQEEEELGLPSKAIEAEALEKRKTRQAQRQDTLKEDWPEIEKEAFSHSLIKGMKDLEEAWDKLPLSTQFKCWNAVMAGLIQAVARARTRATEYADKDIGADCERYHKQVASFAAELLAEWASDFARFRDEIVALQDANQLSEAQIPDFLLAKAEKLLDHPAVGTARLEEWAKEHSTESK